MVGPKEGKGPLGNQFDFVLPDALYGKSSYEQAEQAMMQEACNRCLGKARLAPTDVQALLGGDLLNQIMAVSLTARELSIPFLGIYGACSTMAESLLLGAILVDGGDTSRALRRRKPFLHGGAAVSLSSGIRQPARPPPNGQ